MRTKDFPCDEAINSVCRKYRPSFRRFIGCRFGFDEDDCHLESMYISNCLYAHLPWIHRQISIVPVCKQQYWHDIDLRDRIDIVDQLVPQATSQRFKDRIEVPLL